MVSKNLIVVLLIVAIALSVVSIAVTYSANVEGVNKVPVGDDSNTGNVKLVVQEPPQGGVENGS